MTAPDRVRSLFVPPFEAEPETHGYVFDAKGQPAVTHFARFSETRSEPPCPRGWGRIQYLDDGAALFDEWASWYRATLGDETDLDAIARTLNEAWGLLEVEGVWCVRCGCDDGCDACNGTGAIVAATRRMREYLDTAHMPEKRARAHNMLALGMALAGPALEEMGLPRSSRCGCPETCDDCRALRLATMRPDGTSRLERCSYHGGER